MSDQTMVFVRNPYNYDRRKATIKSGLACLDESLTVQDQAEDVNDMVRKFGITGKISASVRVPVSGDFTGIGTYQECLEAVTVAQNRFMELPATVRERFKHDPQQFIEFCEDENNADEGEKLGIWKLKKRADEAAKATPAAAPAANSGKPE